MSHRIFTWRRPILNALHNSQQTAPTRVHLWLILLPRHGAGSGPTGDCPIPSPSKGTGGQRNYPQVSHSGQHFKSSPLKAGS